MTTQPEYILATGDKDYQRLMLLSRLYNPGALAFMKTAGLKPGMKVLEIGCGTGHMAVDLAKVVGDTGVVVAIDNSDSAGIQDAEVTTATEITLPPLHEKQLAIAKHTAKEAGINNIQFIHLDLHTNLPRYHGTFDFTYGRWVIEFTKSASEKVFQQWFDTLKPNGVWSTKVST